MADIKPNHPAEAPLQKSVGESASGLPDIKSHSPRAKVHKRGMSHGESLKSTPELETAARDEALGRMRSWMVGVEAQTRFRADLLRRRFDWTAHLVENGSRLNQTLGRRARPRQAQLNKANVSPFGHLSRR
jgi:hypothetical protein